MKTCSQQKKILIIKFGGLGDVILSLGAIFSIVNHHKTKTFLLTEKPFDSFFLRSGWFENIITIKRSLLYFMDIVQIKKKIDNLDFDFVYDLQTSKRSSSYLKLFQTPKTITNGIGRYAKIIHDNQNRNNMHTLDRQMDQISMNKIKFRSDMDLKWLFNSKFPIPKQNYVLIVPGGSRKRKNKRLPLEIFNKIIQFLLNNNILVLLIGSKDDEQICKKIKLDFPKVENLCNKTNFFDLGKLSKHSLLSIGNDTGPMHLISKGERDAYVFFTNYSKPELCKPVGKKVFIFRFKNDKENFSNEVLLKLKEKLCL